MNETLQKIGFACSFFAVGLVFVFVPRGIAGIDMPFIFKIPMSIAFWFGLLFLLMSVNAKLDKKI